MFKIAQWYNNFQSPSVLMIDDLSDAYIEVYDESYKNDWGYLCDNNGSSYDFLQKNLLAQYPEIKITYFVPYLKHNVINENSQYSFKKYALGEREEYTSFLKKLIDKGHEISHHGSDHGEYLDKSILTTVNNWKHEWELFDDTDRGVEVTLNGVDQFKKIANIEVTGGKYCGYKMIENSQTIIDKCHFLYWCDRVNFLEDDKKESFFGENSIVSFPTNYPGNSFVRLSYKTSNEKRDKIKSFTKYLQPFYNILAYYQLYQLYKNQSIISIQEHNSPSTSSAKVQSLNIVTDINSLKKIYAFLNKFSIWYATCHEIAKYIDVRENSIITVQDNDLVIDFKNVKELKDVTLSITSEQSYTLQNSNHTFVSKESNGLYVVNLPIDHGENRFKIKKDI